MDMLWININRLEDLTWKPGRKNAKKDHRMCWQ